MAEQTQAKHTPGPWHVQPVVIEEADAHLIAAAPDMYDALYDALGVMRDTAPEFSLLIGRMERVLARARGESS